MNIYFAGQPETHEHPVLCHDLTRKDTRLPGSFGKAPGGEIQSYSCNTWISTNLFLTKLYRFSAYLQIIIIHENK
jgi:hypothetical protein